MVLAAGTGRRLRPDTDALPKTLLPVAGETTILDIGLRNLAAAGASEVVIVVGFAADQVADRVGALERKYDIAIDLVHNDRAEVWNNAYSLWLAREYFGQGVLLVNGDTVHPASVEKTLLAASAASAGSDVGDGALPGRAEPPAGRAEPLPGRGVPLPGRGVPLAARGAPLLGRLIIAIDDIKLLADEEMKVVLDASGAMLRITKAMDPSQAHGEYMGVTLIEPSAAVGLADALEVTWRRDPGLYYEDGFAEFALRGG
jgi:choline kinase